MWTAGVAAESSAKQGFPFVGPAHWVAQNGPDCLTDSPPGPGGYRTRRIVPPLAQAPDCTEAWIVAPDGWLAETVLFCPGSMEETRNVAYLYGRRHNSSRSWGLPGSVSHTLDEWTCLGRQVTDAEDKWMPDGEPAGYEAKEAESSRSTSVFSDGHLASHPSFMSFFTRSVFKREELLCWHPKCVGQSPHIAYRRIA
jgi:hypothetical protein